MTALNLIFLAVNIVCAVLVGRLALRIGRANAALDRRAEQFDLEDADLIERRALLDAAERKLADDTRQFAALLKQANGKLDIGLHNLQRQAEAKLEVPGR